jgi:hypothetical protein
MLRVGGGNAQQTEKKNSIKHEGLVGIYFKIVLNICKMLLIL